jgi:hypothetical protein
MLKTVVEFIRPQEVFMEAHIADLHFGVVDPLKEYQILSDQFLSHLREMNVLDIVSIDGDIFDRKLMANSDAVMYAMMFVKDLVDICIQKNATLIILNGTSSHDSDQLKLFTPFVGSGVDLRLVLNTQFLFVKGKKILCITEEYGKGYDYYARFLFENGMYDACYMHGTFVGSIVGKNKPDLDSPREPVFCMNDFALCRGPIISGHVHIHNIYKKDFYYCGSPLRWRHGEEEPKGYLILLHNLATRQYMVHMEEIESFVYKTINLDDMLKTDPRYMVDYINNLKAQGVDNIRVRFTVEDLDKIAILKTVFANRKDIKIETNFEKHRIQKQLEEMNMNYDKYSYLFDNSTPEDKLVQFINSKEGISYWTTDLLKSFIKEISAL